MYYSREYKSPLGRLTLVCDYNKRHIVGLWLEGQKYYMDGLDASQIIPTLPEKSDEVSDHKMDILDKANHWLDRYFAGQNPPIGELSLKPEGTAFRQEVWSILMNIPYGQVTSYASIARQVAKNPGRESMSAQAVGGAVGHNPISIIIPCHRVLGRHGDLTGYAGGLDKKIWLLNHEGASVRNTSLD